MMNRNSWKFTYAADKLLDAANKKRDWHESRLNWWTEAKEKVMKEIKEEGLEIDESVAMGYSNSGRNASVNVRTDLMRDLNECVAKIAEHKAKRQDYDAWIQVLSSQGQSSLELHQDDW